MNLPSFFSGKPEDKILSVKYKKPIDGQLVTKLIYFIQSACKKSTKVIVEINGTINSLVAGVIFKKALAEKAIAIIFDFNAQKTEWFVETCKNLEMNTYILNRAAAYYKELTAYRLHKHEAIKNFYLRFSNYHLLTVAEHMKAILIDTEDKSDRLISQRPNLFYGTLMPFYSLYKTEVYDLIKFLNIPIENQDEDWGKIDPVLFLLTEKQLTPEQIAQEYNLDLQWLKKLKSRLDKQSFKTPVSQFII